MSSERGTSRTCLLAAAIIVIALLLEGWSRGTPTPVGIDAPADRFSAGRALAVLEGLLGDGAPHPVGSAANERVRGRIVDELEALGLAPELSSQWVCRNVVCAPVVDVLAKIPGRSDGPAVLLLAHYDSVHAGPGAGDDTHGVAVLLEVARALMVGEPPDRPVLLLFDDGEEVGLLGAKAFVRTRTQELAAAINVEARGTTGRTALFESSDGNGELVRRWAGAVPSPEGSSLAVEIYRRMPNDTDFSVLKRWGIGGINLAFIGGVARYHTPKDDLAHLDHGSVQHQGDTVLAAARAFASGEAPEPADDLAFTDLLGLVVVRWPVKWSVPLLLVATLALGFACARALRRGQVRGKGLVLGALGSLLVWIGAAIAGIAMIELVAAAKGGAPAALAHPLPLRLALWGTLGAATLGLARIVARRVRAHELALATWFPWLVLAFVAVTLAPGAAPVFVLPTLTAAVAFAIAALRGDAGPRAPTIGLAAFALVWSALVLGLEDAFGWSLAAAIVVPAAAVCSHAAWACADDDGARRPVLAVCLALALIGGAASLVLDVHDRDHPRRFMIVHLTDVEAGTAVLTVAPGDAMPDELRAAAAFAAAPTPALPWTRAGVWTAPSSQAHDRAPPWLDRLPRADGRERARLVAPWADRAVVMIEENATRITALTVAGESLRPPADDMPWRVNLFGLPPDGVELGLERIGVATAVLHIVACGPALPEDAAALAAARDAVAVTFQWGDAACVVVTERL